MPTEERRALERKSTSELEEQAKAEGDRLSELMKEARSLQGQLQGKTEAEQSTLRDRITGILEQIEKEDTGGTRFGVDVYELRIEVARSVKLESLTDARSFLEKAKWATPSWKGFEAALREMNGDFIKGIGLVAKYLSDLMYVMGFDRFWKKGSSETKTENPIRKPVAQEQRKPAESAPDRFTMSCSGIEDPHTDRQDLSSVFFRATIGEESYELKIHPRGDHLFWKNKKGEWKPFEFRSGESLPLMEYLKNHQQEITFLTGKTKGAEHEDHVRSELIVAFIQAQKKENTKNSPQDILTVITHHWSRLESKLFKGKNSKEIRTLILDTPEKIV